jgi:elongation factor Ts
MKITVKEIAELRKITGAGLTACKKALEAANGDIDAALEAMKKAGQALAEKKADRIATEGAIISCMAPDHKAAILLEINCETDFVSGNEAFQSFANTIAELALQHQVKTHDDLLNLTMLDQQTVEQARQALVAKVGENIQIRRFQRIETPHILGTYTHKGRYGCVTELKGADAEIAKQIAIHVVVSNPQDRGKLLNQDFYREPAYTVGQYLEKHHAELIQYNHFILGDSI